MFLNITDSEKKEKGGNKGSSGQLIHYLEKENRLYKPEQPEQWFNGLGDDYEPIQIRNRLDQNKAKLGRDEAKFFLINISPSQKEIAHLKALYGEQGAKDQLKAYAVKIMDEYARNFKRKGINGNQDLLWFAKLENYRYYSYKDKEVKNGTAKRGDPKLGEQMHIQVIVSRKDITNKIKLSPANNSDGTNEEHSRRMGEFNRTVFKESGERVFDELFNFTRPFSESFRYANAQANGGLADRLAIREEKRREEQKTNLNTTKSHALEFGHSIDITTDDTTLLEKLFARPDFEPSPALKRKKKRKKGMLQQSELSF
jgi:hypothetical protein